MASGKSYLEIEIEIRRSQEAAAIVPRASPLDRGAPRRHASVVASGRPVATPAVPSHLGRRYEVSVRSPAGEVEASFEIPFDARERETQLLIVENALLRAASKLRRDANPDEDALKTFGASLFESLFSPPVRRLFGESKQRADAQDKGLRIRLLNREADLDLLPWELMFDPEQRIFLALSRNTPLVRYLPMPTPSRALTVTGPLRLLGVSASPINERALDVEDEERRLREALSTLSDNVHVRWLRHATRDTLRTALLREDPHILHFAGHGAYDEEGGEGLVLLEGPGGRADRFRGSDFALLLRDQGSLRLAVLNACDGARAGISSLAAQLLNSGVPATIGMQYPVTDDAAIAFARAFYGALVAQLPVDAAVAEARKALALGRSFEWVTPILFMRSPDGVLFDIRRSTSTAAHTAHGSVVPTSSSATNAQRDFPRTATPSSLPPVAPASIAAQSPTLDGDVAARKAAEDAARKRRAWVGITVGAGALSTIAMTMRICGGEKVPEPTAQIEATARIERTVTTPASDPSLEHAAIPIVPPVVAMPDSGSTIVDAGRETSAAPTPGKPALHVQPALRPWTNAEIKPAFEQAVHECPAPTRSVGEEMPLHIVVTADGQAREDPTAPANDYEKCVIRQLRLPAAEKHSADFSFSYSVDFIQGN